MAAECEPHPVAAAAEGQQVVGRDTKAVIRKEADLKSKELKQPRIRKCV
eukprot:COSAG01_NODE_32833_length_574_cov_1.614737_1_plen_48_part_10